MKRTIAILLALLMVLSFAACGGGTTTPTPEPTPEATPEPTPEATPEPTPEPDVFINLREDVETTDFTFKINTVGFASKICIESGNKLGLYNSNGDSVAASDGYVWLYYAIKYSFKGKDKTDAKSQFVPVVIYNDYTFSDDNLRFIKVDNDWSGLEYKGSFLGLPLPAEYWRYEYDPWVDKEYELHGAIMVAKKAVEDTESQLILQFSFNLGNGNNETVKCIVNSNPITIH